MKEIKYNELKGYVGKLIKLVPQANTEWNSIFLYACQKEVRLEEWYNDSIRIQAFQDPRRYPNYIWNLNRDFHFDEHRVLIYEVESGITSNKGRKECFFCQCPTEMKRDFKDMSIREFCPRCKR